MNSSYYQNKVNQLDKEIAEIMNATENWVRVTFYRGKEKIKEDNNDE